MNGNLLTKVAVGGAVALGIGLGTAQMAGATELPISWHQECVPGKDYIKAFGFIVSNPWDVPIKVTVQTSAGSIEHTVEPDGSWAYQRTASTKFGNGGESMSVSADHGIAGQTKATMMWTKGECGPELPTTTTPVDQTCPEGERWSNVPPVGCIPNEPTTVVPPEEIIPVVSSTTTVPVIPLCDPGWHLIHFEDGSYKCDDGTYYGPPKSTPTTKPIYLPTTGSETNLLVGAGIGAATIGTLLALVARRRSAA